jgi:hypothetical protein
MGATHGRQDWILCCYRNVTNRMVVVRVRGEDSFALERVVFPFEIMTFHCPRDGEVEVIMRMPTGMEQSEWIAAEHLLADDVGAEALGDWRPPRNHRGLSLRANASHICMDGL